MAFNFISFDFACDMELQYNEYIDECEAKGLKALSFQEWYDSIE